MVKLNHKLTSKEKLSLLEFRIRLNNAKSNRSQIAPFKRIRAQLSRSQLCSDFHSFVSEARSPSLLWNIVVVIPLNDVTQVRPRRYHVRYTFALTSDFEPGPNRARFALSNDYPITLITWRNEKCIRFAALLIINESINFVRPIATVEYLVRTPRGGIFFKNLYLPTSHS